MSTRADERFRPQSPAQLPINTTEDRLFFVPGAQVSYVNYDLVRRDFKQTSHMSNAEIDAWILSNFAYVSEGQLKLRGLWTTPFEVDMSKSKTGYRPPNYIRSAMLQADGGGLVDVKGIGYPLGARVEAVLQNTEQKRQRLRDARKALENAVTPEDREKAENAVKDAAHALTHTDGSMRSGEALAEIYKQEALQNVANRLNRKNNAEGSPQPRIETVETYFALHLPWKVKDALGEREESISLYGRQATAGHGRGSPVSADIAYNPFPKAGLNPGEVYRGSNALQISNSGAIFDYGSIVVTEPEARALHGYHHFTQDAVDRGAYFDLYDSNINNFAYQLALDMDEKPDSWDTKREWLMQQRRTLVPAIGSEPAELEGGYAQLVHLYQAAVNHEFGKNEARILRKKMVRSLAKNLGDNRRGESAAIKESRIEHLTLVTILAALDKNTAQMFVEEGERASVPQKPFLRMVTPWSPRIRKA
jgi:hypothetical protein